MRTNADMTLYHWNGAGYNRREIRDVWWENAKISNTEKTGMVNADAVTILIPAGSAPDLAVTTGKDMVVKGICEFEFDNSSEESRSAGMKQLKADQEVFTVNAFDPMLFGSPNIQHYELSCK